ncbi:MAG: dihydrolipoyl dehydrogenase [Candidatus Omnitrophica bacterium]|nr:dihydrolipoyl dehydrogenase [Candidatus Omnitrophota bacterium]
MQTFDLCVLGGGPGGLSAAIRGAQQGASVCLVDPGPIGGTCLNRGCIPARSFGTTAKLMAQLRNGQAFGIRSSGGFKVDLERVVGRKERILRRLRAGLVGLLKQSKVTWIQGEGILQGPGEVEVRSSEKPAAGLRAKGIILATGSRPGSLPGCPVDGKTVVTSDELLDLRAMPASFIVVGAGVVGSEFSSYFVDLGVPVTVIEAAERLLPFEEEKIARAFAESLARRGATLLTGTKVRRIDLEAGSGPARVSLENGRTLSADLVLMATGRVPTLPKGSDGIGLKLHGGGVPVDERLRTQVPSVFAVGDLLGEYQLACTASYEGMVAAENALGGSREVNYEAVPDAIYTEPEIASVGLTEAEAVSKGREVTVSALSLSGFARAQTFEETEGFVQVVADRSTGRLIGVQMLGARATDLIGEATLAVKQRLTLKDLTETLHGHPTMSESLWEAAAMALGQSIYYATSR